MVYQEMMLISKLAKLPETSQHKDQPRQSHQPKCSCTKDNKIIEKRYGYFF